MTILILVIQTKFLVIPTPSRDLLPLVMPEDTKYLSGIS